MNIEDIINKQSYDYYYKDVCESLMRKLFNEDFGSLNSVFEKSIREAYAQGFTDGMSFQRYKM